MPIGVVKKKTKLGFESVVPMRARSVLWAATFGLQVAPSSPRILGQPSMDVCPRSGPAPEEMMLAYLAPGLCSVWRDGDDDLRRRTDSLARASAAPASRAQSRDPSTTRGGYLAFTAEARYTSFFSVLSSYRRRRIDSGYMPVLLVGHCSFGIFMTDCLEVIHMIECL
jgi:hypothetical protein